MTYVELQAAIEAEQLRCLRVRERYLDHLDFEPAIHIKAALDEATTAVAQGVRPRMEAALLALTRIE